MYKLKLRPAEEMPKWSALSGKTYLRWMFELAAVIAIASVVGEGFLPWGICALAAIETFLRRGLPERIILLFYVVFGILATIVFEFAAIVPLAFAAPIVMLGMSDYESGVVYSGKHDIDDGSYFEDDAEPNTIDHVREEYLPRLRD